MKFPALLPDIDQAKKNRKSDLLTQLGSNPFNQRRTTSEEEFGSALEPKKASRREKDSKPREQVELKAASNEQSQMFMDSQSQYPSQIPALTRFTDGFQGTQILNTLNQDHNPRITVNLEDAVLQEQKLFSILEVS